MSLSVGGYVIVADDVSGPLLWHERLVLAACRTLGWYAVLSPSLNTFAEHIDDDNRDLLAWRRPGRDGLLPAGILRGRSYRFEERPVGTVLEHLIEHSRRVSAQHDGFANEVMGAPNVLSTEDRARGDVPLASPLGLIVNLVRRTGSSGRSRRTSESSSKGSRLALPANAMGIGGAALGPSPSEVLGTDIVFYRGRPPGEPHARGRDVDMAQTEARTIPVRFDAQGERRRTFPEAVAEMVVQGRFPVAGAEDLSRFPQVDGVGRWQPRDVPPPLALRKPAPDGDRAVYEDEVFCMMLQAPATITQVNCANLVGCEMLCRRVQLLREA